jgi:hypothetical protein
MQSSCLEVFGLELSSHIDKPTSRRRPCRRLPTTNTGTLQSSHVTRYACVIWPCHICGRSDDVTVPARESLCLELIFSTRVPVGSAPEGCGVWERIAGVI